MLVSAGLEIADQDFLFKNDRNPALNSSEILSRVDKVRKANLGG